MNIINAANELQARAPVCLAIGFFDGVHLGHQQIIRQTISDARQHRGTALVVSFKNHPATILAPDRVPPLIYSLPQKIRTIEELGADATLLLSFDEALSRVTGEEFIRRLANDIGRIESICVGADFTFGHQRSGDVALLKRLGLELNFRVHGIAAVSLDGQLVRSTRIREAVRTGDFDAAGQMLGRAYALSGKVIRGEGVGKQLGYATANMDTNGLVLPRNGVYAVVARARVATHQAVVNIGLRPTIKTTAAPRVEAHLLDFSGDLYGEELEVTFIARLRDEKKFESSDALSVQIGRDIEAARRQF